MITLQDLERDFPELTVISSPNSDIASEMITGISSWSRSEKTEVGVAYSRSQIEQCRSDFVLCEYRMIISDKNLIMCPKDSLVRYIHLLAEYFIAKGRYRNFNIPPAAHRCAGGYLAGEHLSVGADTHIGQNVTIGDDVIIGSNCVIESGSIINSCTVIGDGVIIRSGAVIGAQAYYHYFDGKCQKSFPGIAGVKIHDGVLISANTVIERGVLADTVIGRNTVVGHQVCIGHDCCIGENVCIVSQAGIAGEVVIDDKVTICGQVGVANNLHIGAAAVIKGKGMVTRNIAAGEVISGRYSMRSKDELRIIAMLKRMIRR